MHELGIGFKESCLALEEGEAGSGNHAAQA